MTSPEINYYISYKVEMSKERIEELNSMRAGLDGSWGAENVKQDRSWDPLSEQEQASAQQSAAPPTNIPTMGQCPVDPNKVQPSGVSEPCGYTTSPLQTPNLQQPWSESEVPMQRLGLFQRGIQQPHRQIINPENRSFHPPGHGPALPPGHLPPLVGMVNPPIDGPPSLTPGTYLEKAIAMYNFVGEREDELSFQENSLIYVLKKHDDGWWEGMYNGMTGIFPGNRVRASSF